MRGSAALDEFVGVVGRPHGTDGTMSIVDAPPQSLTLHEGIAVGVGYTRDFVEVYHVRSYVEHGSRRRIAFREITSAEQAILLAERAIYAPASAVNAQSDERFAIGDLLDCSVIDVNGNVIGTITDVWLLPANDVWEVTTSDGSTIPLPVIDDVILDVSVESKTITVRLMDGLDQLGRVTADDDIDA